MVVNFDRLVHHLCSGTSGENLSYASWHDRPERSIDASGGACAQITARHPSIAHDDMIAMMRLTCCSQILVRFAAILFMPRGWWFAVA